MRNLCDPEIAKWRDHEADRLVGTKDAEREHAGAFLIMRTFAMKRVALRVIASDGEGWDHVSVSLSNRTPTWEEMDFIKGLFFHDRETVMELHVPRREHVNNHPFCLHLWRPQRTEIPKPPPILVGISQAELMKGQLPLPTAPNQRRAM